MSSIKKIDTVDNSYLSFLASFRTFAQNWSFVHHFGMNSWEYIDAQFISFKSWDDGLPTRLFGKGKATNEVIFSEMPRA